MKHRSDGMIQALAASLGLNVALVAALGLLSDYVHAPAVLVAIQCVKAGGLLIVLLLVAAFLWWLLTLPAIGGDGKRR